MTDASDKVRALLDALEQNKLQLLKLEAKKTLRQHRFFAFQEQTPVADRLELAAEIAALEQAKQELKMQLLALKQGAKDKRARGMLTRLLEKMRELGLEGAIEEIRKQAEDDMTEAENEIYKAKI